MHTSVIPPGTSQCSVCGMFVTGPHGCGGTPTFTPMVDLGNMLYDAAYKQGYQAAQRERDLSPLGKRMP